jgi:hypothetical protein
MVLGGDLTFLVVAISTSTLELSRSLFVQKHGTECCSESGKSGRIGCAEKQK